MLRGLVACVWVSSLEGLDLWCVVLIDVLVSSLSRRGKLLDVVCELPVLDLSMDTFLFGDGLSFPHVEIV